MQRKSHLLAAANASQSAKGGVFEKSKLLWVLAAGALLVVFFLSAGVVQSACTQSIPIFTAFCPHLAVRSLPRRNSTLRKAPEAAQLPPIATQISSRPRIFLVENIVTPVEAQSIIDTARPHLERSRTGGAPSKKEGDISQIRTSEGMFMVTQQQVALVAPVAERVAQVTGIPVERFEAMQVLRYEAGQQYHPHPDYFDGELLASVKGRGGNRVATIIMYLNDVINGGETAFPMANITVKPKVGGGVLFWSMNEDGTMEPRSLHAGRPVGVGEQKWVSVYWLREDTIR